MPYRIYVSDVVKDAEPNLVSGYSYKVWKPSLTSPIPPTLGKSFLLWTYAHYLRIFHNRDYSVLFILNSEGNIVHRSCVIPAYFRWPFMGRMDLQISSTWTDPNERGKGLATSALLKAMQINKLPERKFWYVTREANDASIKVCEKAGFILVGRGERVSWMGIKLLGRLVMKD